MYACRIPLSPSFPQILCVWGVGGVGGGEVNVQARVSVCEWVGVGVFTVPIYFLSFFL